MTRFTQNRLITIGTIIAVVIAAWLVLMALSQPEDGSAAKPLGESTLSTEMGMTYIAVNPHSARYYGLTTDYGVLVTEVTEGSLADLYGVQAGDVILSYNGTHLREGTPLFTMMKACPAGSMVTLDIQRGNDTRTIELFHAPR